MMQAMQLEGTMWQVTAEDGRLWTVALREDANSAEAAVAVVAGMLAPPAGQVAAAEALARAEAARAECRRRILAVAPETAQLNLTAAAAAGILSTADRTVYKAAVVWIAAMRAAWPKLGAGEWTDAKQWPAVPAGLTELVSRY